MMHGVYNVKFLDLINRFYKAFIYGPTSSCKVNVPFFLSDSDKTWIYSAELRKIPSNIEFHKIPPAVAELFHAHGRIDRQTERHSDITKIIVAFRIFAKSALKPFLEKCIIRQGS